jgi:hypothetical protein
VEGADYQPAGEVSPVVRQALPELVEQVVEEVEGRVQGAGGRE